MKSATIVIAAAGACALLALPAAAQTQPARPPAVNVQTAPPAKQAGKELSGEGQLRQRVEQLEEQLVDLQVTIGTLESLARPGGSGAVPSAGGTWSPGGLPGPDSGRIDLLEVKLRSLTAEVERLAAEVRSRGAASAPPAVVGQSPPARAGGFGTVTVTPGVNDQIGRIIQNDAAAGVPGRAQPPVAPASVPAGGEDPRELYKRGYDLLLQQNWGAAETAFSEFLARHPGDALAGSAQYWLGETHFVRGDYKPAAAAFLKGYQSYQSSPKAPNSLFKLAQSLDRLGQRNDACGAFGELAGLLGRSIAEIGASEGDAERAKELRLLQSRTQAEQRRIRCGG